MSAFVAAMERCDDVTLLMEMLPKKEYDKLVSFMFLENCNEILREFAVDRQDRLEAAAAKAKVEAEAAKAQSETDAKVKAEAVAAKAKEVVPTHQTECKEVMPKETCRVFLTWFILFAGCAILGFEVAISTNNGAHVVSKPELMS